MTSYKAGCETLKVVNKKPLPDARSWLCEAKSTSMTEGKIVWPRRHSNTELLDFRTKLRHIDLASHYGWICLHGKHWHGKRDIQMKPKVVFRKGKVRLGWKLVSFARFSRLKKKQRITLWWPFQRHVLARKGKVPKHGTRRWAKSASRLGAFPYM